jgi:hypothetical protein
MSNTQTGHQAVEKVFALSVWSENCQHPTPFALFLDLIGWSEDTYGERLCSESMPAMGYIEAYKLAQALEAWSDHPREVEAFVSDLIEQS